VNIIDDVSRDVGVTRSAIIRDVLDRVAGEYEKVLTATKKIYFKNHPLLKMAGIIKGTKPGVAENIDEIYLQD